MKIQGENRPITHKEYTYKLINNEAKAVKVDYWQIKLNATILKTNDKGTFSFGLTLANTTVKLIAVVINKGQKTDYSINLPILAGKPQITSIEWQDSAGKPIGSRKVGYLDKIQLAIKTMNIPKGDPLKVEVFEVEKIKDRSMGAPSVTSAVNDKGFAYLYFNQLSLYQKKLNDADWFKESEHEYYVRVEYKNHINQTDKKVQLTVQNTLTKEIDKPKPTNNPVVVGATTSPKNKQPKNKIDVVFNMFFDGTLNNMTNTRARLERNDKSSKLAGVYDKVSNKKDDSFMNFYSNVALLFMNNTVEETADIISIYTEGIGTRDKKGDQDAAAVLGDSIAIPVTRIFSINVYKTGIRDKVKRGISLMRDKVDEKYFIKNKKIGKVTINVFGFSRGAAAARHFMSKESDIVSALKLDSKKDIQFNFIGLFDTVASFGVMHLNDVSDLNLDIGGKAKKVIQLAAADEYRVNFKLTDITSSIAAGVGYQLTMPGVHSDIGGGYREWETEKRFLGKEQTHDKNETPQRLVKLRQKFIDEGWYRDEQIRIAKETDSEFSPLGTHRFVYKHTLWGNRKDTVKIGNTSYEGLPNTYQYIPLAIMKTFCVDHGKMLFDTNEIKKYYEVKGELVPIKKQLHDYAISHDSVRAYSVTLAHKDLMWVRNRYLHRSNKDDEIFTMAGRYNGEKPERDILIG